MERSRTPLEEVGLFLSGRTGAEWSDFVVGEGTPCPWTEEERGTVEWAKAKLIPMRVR